MTQSKQDKLKKLAYYIEYNDDNYSMETKHEMNWLITELRAAWEREAALVNIVQGLLDRWKRTAENTTTYSYVTLKKGLDDWKKASEK
jgi:hypothetical protein